MEIFRGIMDLKNLRGKKLPLILFCLFSFIAGGINGFLGTGGGIILVLMLSYLTNNSQRDNLATSLCATVVFSLFSSVSYGQGGNIDFPLIFKIAIPTAIGGLVGAYLVDKLSTRALSVIFASLLIYSGLSLIFK